MDSWTKVRISKLKTDVREGIADGIAIFYRILEVALFLPLLVLLAATIYAAYLGLTEGNHNLASSAGTAAGAIATLFLVGITVRYARQTREMANSIRLDQRREHIFDLVTQIDRLRELLRDQGKELDEVTQAGLEPIGFPQIAQASAYQAVVADVENEYPAVAEVLIQYLRTADEYHDIYMELVDDLEAEIESDFRPSKLPETIEGILPPEKDMEYLTGDAAEFAAPQEIFKSSARRIAYCVIADYPESPASLGVAIGPNQLAQVVFLQYREEFMELRSAEPYAEDFSELEGKFSLLKQRNRAVRDSMLWIRKRWMDEYQIMESEVSGSEIHGVV